MTNEQEIRLLARIALIEKSVSSLIKVQSNLASTQQIQEISAVLMDELNEIKDRLDQAEQRLFVLEEYPED